jgi:dipeptidyl aminopeptidase/acylaminoacyl peptidase
VDPDRQDTIQYAPEFLPDGTHFLYTARSTDQRNSAVLVGSIDPKPEAQSRTALVRSFWGAQYASSAEAGAGYVLFMRDDTLMAQPMDLRRLVTTGQAVPVAEHIEDGRAFSVSGNGVLVFQQQSTKARLTWFDREGAAAGTIGDLDFFRTLALSRDGTRALLATGPFEQASNLWLLDLAHGLRTRIGLSSASEDEPVWTPAGDRVIFASNRGGGNFDLYQQAVNSAGAAEVLCQSAQDKLPLSCSRDGRYLLYSVNSRSTGSDIWLLPLEGPRKPLPFLQTEADKASARFSPDSRWVAYTSNESGRNEIYVRSFSMKPGVLAVESGDKHLISDSGGVSPRWRGDGRELYYLRAADQMLMAVEIAGESGFRAGHPHAIGAAITRAWDAAPDGKSFLATVLANPKPQPYTVVLNWQATLKR